MENSKNNKHVNIDYILENLDKGSKYIEAAKDQNLVIIIGNTGGGKSTLCNSLLGHTMKEVKYNYKPVIETEGITNIKIGHGISAETLYAQTVPIGDGTSLVDCPGFLGNRAKEESIVESISIELTIRNAERVNAILLVISFCDIEDCRLGQLRKLVKMLIALFKNPVKMVQHTIVIITKKNKYMPTKEAKQITIGAMESLKKHCKEQSKRFSKAKNLHASEDLTPDDYNMIETYFAAILQNPERIILFDPLDRGESKELIFWHINKIEENSTGKEISLKDFNFSKYCETRESFNKAVYYRADNGMELIKKICQEAEKIEKFPLKIKDFQNEISELNNQKSAVEGDIREVTNGSNNIYTFESIGTSRSLINRHNEQIKSKESESKYICEKEEILLKELKSIDHDTPLKFLKKYFHESFDINFKKRFWRSVGEWFCSIGYYIVSFDFDTGDRTIPIIGVEGKQQNGKWIDKVDERNIGIYKVKYESDYLANPIDATVITFIRTKDEKGNKIIIKRLGEECEQLKKKQKRLASEINDLKSENRSLESNIKEAKTVTTLNRVLDKCKSDIGKCNSTINNELKAVKAAQASGLENLEKFINDQNKYVVVVKINDILTFQSSIVNKFCLKYDEFLLNINNYRSCFERDIKNFNE